LLDIVKNPFEFSEVIHGTYYEPLDLIMKHGLNRMARNHIHMAVGWPGAEVISGMRGNCQVVVEVNLVRAMYAEHRLPFYCSTNKVILCEGVKNIEGQKDGALPPQYFRSIVDTKN